MIFPPDHNVFVRQKEAQSEVTLGVVRMKGAEVGETAEMEDEIIFQKTSKFSMDGEEFLSVPIGKILVKNMIPTKGRIFIEIDPTEEISKGGIFIPEVSKERACTGKIATVWNGCTDFIVGTRVMLMKGVGVPVIFNEKELLLVEEGMIVAVE